MLILASASPRRKQILESMKLSFEIIPSNADESVSSTYLTESIPLVFACKKASAIATSYHNDTIIAADTIVIHNGEIFNKPKDENDAVKTLLTLSGKTHNVITGVCILRLADNLIIRFSETSSVTFKKFNKSTALKYMNLVNVMDKAGAYGIQEYKNMIISSFSGSKTNIMGFPLERFKQIIHKKVLFSI